MRKALREHSLSIVFGALFLAALVGSAHDATGVEG